MDWAFDLDDLGLRFVGNAADFVRNHADPPCRGVNRQLGLAPLAEHECDGGHTIGSLR